MNKQLCKITNAQLGFIDRGFFMMLIDVDYGHMCRTIASPLLSAIREHDDQLVEAIPAAADFVIGVLHAAGVDRVDQLKGRVLFAVWDGAQTDSPPMNTMPHGLLAAPFERGGLFLFSKFLSRVVETKTAMEKRVASPPVEIAVGGSLA